MWILLFFMYWSERVIDVFKAKCQVWVNVLMITTVSSLYISFILIVAKFYCHTKRTYCNLLLTEFNIVPIGYFCKAFCQIMSVVDLFTYLNHYRRELLDNCCIKSERIRSKEGTEWTFGMCERISPFLFDIKHYFITFVYSCWFKKIS